MEFINNIEAEAYKHAGALTNAAEAIADKSLLKDDTSKLSAKSKCEEAFDKSRELRENFKNIMKEESVNILAVSEKYMELDENSGKV